MVVKTISISRADDLIWMLDAPTAFTRLRILSGERFPEPPADGLRRKTALPLRQDEIRLQRSIYALMYAQRSDAALQAEICLLLQNLG